jgi:bacillithiol system protein YtxJ
MMDSDAATSAISPNLTSGEPAGVTFVEVKTAGDLERLFALSDEGTIVLFLHDPWCPVSGRAHREVRAAGGEVYIVDVSRRHDLNRLIEQKTGVRHESPQAFLIRDGRPVWHASHGRVTALALSYARDSPV